jgi:hypothetical protein
VIELGKDSRFILRVDAVLECALLFSGAYLFDTLANKPFVFKMLATNSKRCNKQLTS